MSLKNKLLETISEMEPIDLNVNSKTNLDDLEEKMEYTCKKIAEQYYKLNNKLSIINNIIDLNFNSNYINTDFNRHEHIEEQLDSLIFKYQNLKTLLNKGREIRYLKEIKEKEKENEIRCARNTLVQLGIKPLN